MMGGGYGKRKSLMRFTKHQECSFCKRTFLSTQELISHFDSFHSTHHFTNNSSSSSTALTTAFRHTPYPNRNPNFPVRNHFDLSYYRSGYLDAQGRFHKGAPPANRCNNSLFGQQYQPKLMDLFPEPSPESDGTLPLLCQLEQRRPEATMTENSYGAMVSYVDLTLRL